MLKEKVIDSHIHIEALYDEKGNSFIDGIEEYREKMGLSAINLASLPSGKRNVSNNIMMAFYKLAHKSTYAHGGLVYPEYPVPYEMPEGMDFVTQYRELMEIGFDGIKMLEGKPSLNKLVGRDLSDDKYDLFFNEIEKNGTHLIFHVNDPEEFWTDDISEDLKARGWWYADGTYRSNTEIYNQINKILEKHPNLCVNFAHFYFYSKSPEKLEELFEKYPNVGVDLTPGGEMYLGFDARWEYYKEFFKKYSKRIQLGTDVTFPVDINGAQWLFDRVYRYIATSDTFKGFEDKIHTGMCLPKETCEDIFYKNFERTVGKEPREINKEALRTYIEKYRHQMRDEECAVIDELIKKYL